MAKATVKKSNIETPTTKSVARRQAIQKGESISPNKKTTKASKSTSASTAKKSSAKTAVEVTEKTAKKRRSKAEIEAEKKAKAERKAAIAAKKAEKEVKQKEREQKRLAKEAKLKEKEEALKAKELQKLEDANVQKTINKLKIDTKKYCAAKPMTPKEKDLCKKILLNDPRMSICSQFYGSHLFNILNWRETEFLIKIDNIYYFYNKAKNIGINFGSVFDTWLDTSKKIPWTDKDPKVNIKTEEKQVVTEEQKKAITKKTRGAK